MRSQESLYGIMIGLFLIGLVFIVSSIYYYQYNPKYIQVNEKSLSLADLGNYIKAMIGVKTAESAREASSAVLSSGFGMTFSCPCSVSVDCNSAKNEYEKEFVGIMGDFLSMLQGFSKTNNLFYPYNVTFSYIGNGLAGGISQSCSGILSGAADESFTVYLKNLSINIQDSIGNMYKIVAPAGADIIHNRMWFLYRKVKSWIDSGGSSCLLNGCNPSACANSLQNYINDLYVICTGKIIEDYRSQNGGCGVPDSSCCRNGYKVCTIVVNCTDTKYYQYINGKNLPFTIIIRGTLYASLHTYYDTCVKEYHCTCVNGHIANCILTRKYARLCTCETKSTCPSIGSECTQDVNCVVENCCRKICCCYCCGNCCSSCGTCC